MSWNSWTKVCLLALGILALAGERAAAADVVGVGASFPAPVIEAWAKQFSTESGVFVHYRSLGSGEGIRRVTKRAAVFAMTDVPLTDAELRQDDLLQFPVVVGAIVPVVNIPGVAPGSLKLTGTVLADIFLGKISTWDSPAIRVLNPDLALPSVPIVVVHRVDGSGTSFVFTHYLSKVSSEWQERLGIGSRLRWPTGLGATGNAGVAQMVHDTVGALGYTEFSYAFDKQLATVQLQNKAGRFLRPSDSSVHAALATANWSRPSYYDVLTNREGADSWPIVGISFVLIHKQQDSRAEAEETLQFLNWIYRKGKPSADTLHYVSLEDAALIDHIESSWNEIRDEDGHPIWKSQ